jgi:hypothetical protein
VDDPGAELSRAESRRIDGVRTPFRAEFARSSKRRDGAPTLVPVSAGGSPIVATVIVLRRQFDPDAARELLYRRESGTAATTTKRADSDPSWIHELSDFAGVDVCLYTALPSNIDSLTVETLAELAISSARMGAGEQHRDGISYLLQQKNRRVETPLMAAYETEILRRTGTTDLRAAWAVTRRHARTG